MHTIYARWMMRICLRFVSNLSKRCPFADFNRPKLDRSTNLQKKAQHWRANIFNGMELLNNALHIREMEFEEFSQIWK